MIDLPEEPNEEIPGPQPAAPGRLHAVLGAVVPLLMITVLAATAGSLFGMYVVDPPLGAAEKPVPTHQAAVKPSEIKPLPSIVTNLAGPQGSWVRLETSIVIEGDSAGQANLLAARIADDLLGYLRTISLDQIEGASGFQHLREDLIDRARIRSKGQVRDLLIHTLLLE